MMEVAEGEGAEEEIMEPGEAVPGAEAQGAQRGVRALFVRSIPVQGPPSPSRVTRLLFRAPSGHETLRLWQRSVAASPAVGVSIWTAWPVPNVSPAGLPWCG